MYYGENGMVKFLETLADNVFRHNYSMMQIKKKIDRWKMFGLPRSTPLINVKETKSALREPPYVR